MVHPNKKLRKIQEVQIDYLEDLMQKLEKNEIGTQTSARTFAE